MTTAEKSRCKSRYWVIPNVVGIGTYLYFASWVWPPAGEEHFVAGPGDPIVWALTAFPVLALYLLINLAWLTMILLSLRRGKGWTTIRAWAIVIIAWFAANRYDSYHHYVESETLVRWSCIQRGSEMPVIPGDTMVISSSAREQIG